MTSLWTPEQQAWLKALGHRVLVLAGDDAGQDGEAASSRPMSPPGAPGPDEDGRAAARERGAAATPVSDERARARPAARPGERALAPSLGEADAAAPAGSPRATPSRAPDDALERAVLGATGQRTRSEARAVLERLAVDVQALRGNPAAKRALWRKLRPLRPRLRP